MVTFIIIRHGYSKFNKEHRFTGQLDVPLDEIGLTQAQNTARYILNNFKVDKIYSSDLCRAYDTARPIAEALGLPIITRRDLREMSVGIWEGRLIEEVKAEYSEAFDLYKSDPGSIEFQGGESYGILTKRVLNALREIANDNDGKTVVISTHGGVVRALRCAWYGYSVECIGDIPHVPNSSVTVVNYGADGVKFLLTGYSDHLTDKTTEATVK